jgi:uncharacterized protein
MKIIAQESIPNNHGRAYVLRKAQRLRIGGTTIVDLVLFNLHNLSERFDQARTKAAAGKIFVSTGDYLVSKSDRPLMKLIADGYTEGTHDLDKGMCSASAYQYQLKVRRGQLEKQGERSVKAVPDHGCWENLTAALKPWDIAPEDIPNPFNIFMTMAVDGETGSFCMSPVRPKKVAQVDFEAQIDCLVGISACPDTMVGGKPVAVTIYEA